MPTYTPELGQYAFGQPFKEYAVPAIMEAAILAIRDEMDRVLSNLGHHGHDPFVNSADAFKCKEFGVWAYSWGDEEQPYNFRHLKSGVAISWYKYFGRGSSANIEITPDAAARVLEHCVKCLRAVESGALSYQIGALGEVPYFEETPAR